MGLIKGNTGAGHQKDADSLHKYLNGNNNGESESVTRRLAHEPRGANGLAVASRLALSWESTPDERSDNAKLLHPELESRAVHSQTRRRTAWSR